MGVLMIDEMKVEPHESVNRRMESMANINPDRMTMDTIERLNIETCRLAGTVIWVCAHFWGKMLPQQCVLSYVISTSQPWLYLPDEFRKSLRVFLRGSPLNYQVLSLDIAQTAKLRKQTWQVPGFG
jgi:hypothetical protein